MSSATWRGLTPIPAAQGSAGCFATTDCPQRHPIRTSGQAARSSALACSGPSRRCRRRDAYCRSSCAPGRDRFHRRHCLCPTSADRKTNGCRTRPLPVVRIRDCSDRGTWTPPRAMGEDAANFIAGERRFAGAAQVGRAGPGQERSAKHGAGGADKSRWWLTVRVRYGLHVFALDRPSLCVQLCVFRAPPAILGHDQWRSEWGTFDIPGANRCLPYIIDRQLAVLVASRSVHFKPEPMIEVNERIEVAPGRRPCGRCCRIRAP